MNNNNFDKDFNRMRIAIFIVWIISMVVGLSLFGFLVWVVIMLLRFFGVI